MKNRTEAKNAFNARAYDRLYIFVRKGMAAVIRRRAAQRGRSVNGYVVELIMRDLKNADE